MDSHELRSRSVERKRKARESTGKVRKMGFEFRVGKGKGKTEVGQTKNKGGKKDIGFRKEI